YAATDGDPATAWTAPQRVVQHKSPPTLTLTLPRPTEVAGLRLAPSRSTLPAHPTVVAVNLGDGPQARVLQPGTQHTPARRRGPLGLTACKQELLISPGPQFVVDGANLSTPASTELPSASVVPAHT